MVILYTVIYPFNFFWVDGGRLLYFFVSYSNLTSPLGDETGDVMSTGPREVLFCGMGGPPWPFFPFSLSMCPFAAIKIFLKT